MNPDFLTMLWIFPISLLVHELEEWNMVKWYDKHFVDMPENKSNESTRFFLIFISVICFVWTGAAVATRSEQIAVIVMLPFVAIVVQNVLQHIYWLFLFKSFSPGIVSATFLLAPICGYILYRGIRDDMIPWWVLSMLMLYLFVGSKETIKAKNTLTNSFQMINRFSNYMIKIFVKK